MSRSPNFRVLHHDDQARLRDINGAIKEINANNPALHIVDVDVHLIDRARDRLIDEDHLLVVLAYALKNKQQQLIDAIALVPGDEHIKFTILYSNEFCFHCTVKNYVVKIRTVVPYRPVNYNYEAFCIKVGKLVKK